MLCISANLKNIISVTEINVAITVPTPVFTPIRLRTNKNASSVVAGIVNSDIENLLTERRCGWHPDFENICQNKGGVFYWLTTQIKVLRGKKYRY